MRSFDVPSLEWGYTRTFRAVRLRDRKDAPKGAPGKWISFLPSSMPADKRRAVFDALAAEVLSTPDFKTKVYQGKMALVPLAISPDRLALMFYCLEADKDDVLPVLQEIARSHRASLLKSGEMAPRDGFLTEWAFKSDAQTTQEMKDGIHDAQLSLIMELFPVENLTPQRKPPKI